MADPILTKDFIIQQFSILSLPLVFLAFVSLIIAVFAFRGGRD